MIRARHLSVNIGDQCILNNISFSVDRAQIIAIIGANGAGKSTLLKTLAGEHTFTEGKLNLFDQTSKNLPLQTRARRIAVLPQFSQLNFSFSVEEVVALGRMPHKSGHLRDLEIVTSVLKELDIEALRKKTYTSLSGGEKQRVQLARNFAQIWPDNAISTQETKLILLDEPTSALDIRHQHALMLSLHSLRKSQVCSLMVMHDFNLAAQYADRVIALHEGRVCADGTPDEVFTLENMRDFFGIDAHILPHPRTQRPVVTV